MTLLVHAFVHDEDGRQRLLDGPGDGSGTAGADRTRTGLRGSKCARAHEHTARFAGIDRAALRARSAGGGVLVR
ncbi:hypothetical protein ACFU6R_09425 [Streptomyces sp. NPDC057499]|uniref:hypothetical protein n=1 Tax=Streptomyces sp. NPDC057499 TaxID=3346150 RepID=UPI00368B83A6